MECHMIRMMFGVRLVDRVSTDALHDRAGVVVKIEDIIQSRLRWYGLIMREDINYHIREVMEVETTGKKMVDQERVGRVHKEGFETI